MVECAEVARFVRQPDAVAARPDPHAGTWRHRSPFEQFRPNARRGGYRLRIHPLSHGRPGPAASLVQ